MPERLRLLRLTGSGLSGSARDADRVDAVPLVGRGGVALALEAVAQVRAAVRAADLGPDAAERAVLDVLDPVLGQRCEERRPATVAVELLGAAEQLDAAGAAVVDTLGVVVPVLTGVRTLGSGLAEHRVLLR